jgi:putative copper resistance protein D
MALALGGGLPRSQLAGLVDAGALTAWGLPVSRLAVDMAAVGTIGMLITTILLPRADGELSVEARRCLRTASGLGLVWGVATAVMLVFTWSDVTALRITDLPLSQVLAGPDASFPDATQYASGAVLAIVIAAGAIITRSVWGAAALLVTACYNLLPLTTTGHAQHSWINAYALTVHVVALSLWVGGLAALLIHARRSPDLLAVAVPRFSNLALICFTAVGISGVTMAWVNLGSFGKLFGSEYGWLVVGKATALATLGFIGWSHRRRTVPAIRRRRRRAFFRLAAVEVLVMAATIALAVALSRSAAPNTVGGGTSHVHAAASTAGPAEAAAGQAATVGAG